MAPGSVIRRIAAGALVAAGTLALATEPAAAQRSEGTGERVRPPTELLEQYPFDQGRLRSRGTERRADANEEGSWPVGWSVFGLMAALLVLAAMGRHVVRASARDEPVSGAQPAPRPRPARFARGRGRPPPRSSYAVVNQKGGVGKTTVSLVLGAAAARRGRRVLLVDLDPQASATSVLGADPAGGPTAWGFDVAQGAGSGDALTLPGDYDLILIDCPPSLGSLTEDALAAASRALVVTEPTFLALQAMDPLLETMRSVAAEQNPSLALAGVVLNRVETTAEHKRGMAELDDAFGAQVWEPHVPKRAILQDAMRWGVPPQSMQSHSHYALEITVIFDALAVRIEASARAQR